MHSRRNKFPTPNRKYKISYLVAHRSNTPDNTADSITMREVGIGAAFAVATTRLLTRGESEMIGQNIAATSQIVRHGCWSRPSSGGDLCGTRTRTRAFGNFHQT
jgi:hypothetical protein